MLLGLLLLLVTSALWFSDLYDQLAVLDVRNTSLRFQYYHSRVQIMPGRAAAGSAGEKGMAVCLNVTVAR